MVAELGFGIARGILIILQALLLANLITSVAEGEGSLYPVLTLLGLALVLALRTFLLNFERKEIQSKSRLLREKRIDGLIKRYEDQEVPVGSGINPEDQAREAIAGIHALDSHHPTFRPPLITMSTLIMAIVGTLLTGIFLMSEVFTPLITITLLALIWETLVLIFDSRRIPRTEAQFEDSGSEVEATDTKEPELKSLGKIKEIRWTDCEILYSEDRSVTFKWGIATTGKLTVITGPAGSGKSSLIRAVMRDVQLDEGRIFLETSKGTFRFDELDFGYLLEQIAWLPTAPHFIPGTIESNLKLIKPRANRERLTEVLRAARLDPDQLEEGLQTIIDSEGTGLTYQQRRQLALARVILKDASIVLVDSAHEPIEAESEFGMNVTLKSLARDGKIVILVTNDSESISLADRKIAFEADHRPPVRVLEPAR